MMKHGIILLEFYNYFSQYIFHISEHGIGNFGL